MKHLHSALFGAGLLLAIVAVPASPGFAEESLATASASPSAATWQLRRLMEPTEAELLRESRGEVVIYDSLTDKEVEAAMSAHPDRIRNMMFLGTIVTDERGEAVFDALGNFAREDDGC